MFTDFCIVPALLFPRFSPGYLPLMYLHKVEVFEPPKMGEVPAYKVVRSDALSQPITAMREFPLKIDKWQFDESTAVTIYRKSKTYKEGFHAFAAPEGAKKLCALLRSWSNDESLRVIPVIVREIVAEGFTGAAFKDKVWVARLRL